MKKTTKLLTGILISTMLLFAGCGQVSKPSDSANSSQPTQSGEAYVRVSPVSESIDIKDEALATYDFTQLFEVQESGDGVTYDKVTVQSSWIDTSAISTAAGTYTVTCTYDGVVGTILVNVIPTVYDVQLSTAEITMNKSLYATYDFKGLFYVTKDGEPIEITDDMITTDLAAETGTYTYTVSVKGINKTLTIHLTDTHDVLIVNTYPEMEITIDELKDFDYTKLFSLYIDGTQANITMNMIDASALANATAGNRYAVVIKYEKDSTKAEKTVYVNVKAAKSLVINAKNVVTAPNSECIDLTDLFEIKYGDTVIPVTDDMISGSIDYSTVGVNTITLSYKGVTKTATVEVKRGVIIEYKLSNVVQIKKGTDQDAYIFEDDFVLRINGITFTGLDGYLDTSKVDFDAVGEYQATLKIPYNDQKFGLSGVKFTYVEASITYEVVENEYTLSVKEEHVRLPIGTTTYNVFNNVVLTINGRNKGLTDRKDWVDATTCYAVVLSDPIDYTAVAAQEVRIAVYVNGADKTPVIVSYTLQIQSTVTVQAIDRVVFEGDTVFTTGLFKITDDGQTIQPTYEHVTGKVDVFKAGVYEVTANYKGVIATAKVIVLSDSIKGTYVTGLETISETSSDSDEDYGLDDTTASTRLGNLVIGKDGSITVDGKKAVMTGAVDEHTILVTLGGYNTYTVYFQDGIAVWDPDNSIRLSYNNDKRPMIYFRQDLWTLEKRVIVSYYSTYVLNATMPCYSIDTFRITSKTTGNSLWYGLKVRLAEKNSVDTIYTVSWGEAEFADNFQEKTGVSSSMTFLGDTYKFTMSSASFGVIQKDNKEKKYSNMTFTGTIDGKSAKLYANQYEGFSLYVGTELLFDLTSMDIENLQNGGVDYDTDTAFFYQFDDGVFFSFKFSLDVANKTFTVEEKDGYTGLYTAENMYIFLDGYGGGFVNFDTGSYYKTQLSYKVYGQKLELRFLNTLPTFEYGEDATLFIDPFMNTLTAAAFEQKSLVGTKFINTQISRGAIVNVSSYKVGAASDAIAKAQLYSNIEIVTKDGVVSDADKATYIKTNLIRFSTPGFYQMTITIDSITSYYAIQVLEAVYEGNSLAATWGTGVLRANNSLLLDVYGQTIFVLDGVTYSGNAKIANGAFTASVYSDEGKTLTLTGTQIAKGLISVKCTGAAVFNDYFTTGSYTQSGTDGFVLRKFTLGTETVYIYSTNATSLGEVVQVNVQGADVLSVGSIFSITTSNNKTIYAKLDDFNDLTGGITLADVYRGTYKADNATFDLDGFGGVTIGGKKGTYEMSGRIALLIVDRQYSAYRLDLETYTATKADVSFDNSLLNGKSYQGTHYYTCNDYMYAATTTFLFGDNGEVTVKSVSSEHDSGDDACSVDKYAPAFASKEGMKGTYSVSGNQVTVQVGGETFVFKIANVVTAAQIVCESGTVESNEHGQIQSGVTFEKV